MEGAVLQQQGDVLSAPSGDTNAVVHVARGLKVFLSYSRKDLDSADQMVPALEAFGHVVSIDREDIFGAERWEERLGQMILEADTVVFLLTPSSAESRACYWEVEQALAQRKRIVPVIAKPLAGAKPHEALRALNYIYFCPDPSVPTAGWGSGLKRLHSTLTVDILWIREHTHIAEMAARWLAERSNEDLLVRGSELVQLQKWRAVRPTSAPELTPQQRGFLEASENAEMLRQDRERQQIEEMRVAQAVKAEALAAQEKAQAERARAVQLVVLRTIVGVAVAAVLSTGIAISGGIAWRNWQKAEQALLRVKDEQLLQDRLIRLARNKEFPSPPYSIDILAKRYEGEGPGDIGTDFMGSVYYGIYRIKADANMEEFLTFSERWGKPLYNKLAAAGGKVAAIKRDPRFIEAWRSLATDAISAAQFAKLQTDFVTRSGYERLAARLKAGYPLRPGQTAQVNLDVGTRSLALRAVIFSVAVQYGPSTRLLQDALSELGDLSMQKDEVIISRIYELRNNVASYFPELQSHSPNFVELIKERNHWEERDALQILSRERS
ncbi:MAG: toll/interleukin-1 receptor domain-containing protein [Hyphomicrobium aestuarii]|nr:toll/interleukin-1 receptor domain-containing protein [Hyphomicrobium aestuarii]